MSRRSSESAFSLFSFQDIITGIIGIILLVVIVLVLRLLETESTSMRQLAKERQDLQTKYSKLKKSLDDIRFVMANPERIDIDSINEAKEAEWQWQLQQQIAAAESTGKRLHKSLETIETQNHQLRNDLQQLIVKTDEVNSGLKRIALQNTALNQESLTRLRENFFNRKNHAGRYPLLVLCESNAITIVDGRKGNAMRITDNTPLMLENTRRARKILQKTLASDEFIVFMVIPGSGGYSRFLIEEISHNYEVAVLPATAEVIAAMRDFSGMEEKDEAR